MSNKPSWDNAPEWANYLAKDFNGIWYWFQHKPEYDAAEGTWNSDCGETISVYADRIHAHNTLESRPVPEEVAYKKRCDEVLLSRGVNLTEVPTPTSKQRERLWNKSLMC